MHLAHVVLFLLIATKDPDFIEILSNHMPQHRATE
jgi:hypothetical protein